MSGSTTRPMDDISSPTEEKDIEIFLPEDPVSRFKKQFRPFYLANIQKTLSRYINGMKLSVPNITSHDVVLYYYIWYILCEDDSATSKSV